MKLAMNWSPQAEELLLAGKIDVDLWKCSDWPELVDPAMKTKSAYVHFPLRTCPAAAPDWNAVRGWMEKTGTKLVNMHLHATQSDFPDIPLESRDPAHRAKVTDAFVRDVAAACDEFGAEKIIVENLPTLSGDDPERYPLFCAVNPMTVREVIERTGCGLLLDIDHARISSVALGMDPKEYIESLPVDRIGELHVAGVGRLPSGRLDDHMGLSDECWTYVDWAIERMRSSAWKTPDICAFEYGGIGPAFAERSDIRVMEEQVPILLRKVRSLNK